MGISKGGRRKAEGGRRKGGRGKAEGRRIKRLQKKNDKNKNIHNDKDGKNIDDNTDCCAYYSRDQYFIRQL